MLYAIASYSLKTPFLCGVAVHWQATKVASAHYEIAGGTRLRPLFGAVTTGSVDGAEGMATRHRPSRAHQRGHPTPASLLLYPRDPDVGRRWD